MRTKREINRLLKSAPWPIETPKVQKTNVELGNIMLAKAGEAACKAGYGTTDPEWVGIYALQYRDINADGVLN